MKNRIKDSTSTLTFRLWGYFVSFAIALFIILWFMQVIFLQSYYSSMKKNEVTKLATKIEDSYINGDFASTIDSLAYKNGINVFLFDKDGNIKYESSGAFNEDSEYFDMYTRPITSYTGSVLKKIFETPQKAFESSNKKVSYTIKLDRFKSEMFIYGKVIPDTDVCLVMATSIDPIDATTTVIQNQLLYITVISLLISSIISIFLSKRISSPLVKINDTAKKLARGNYDIKFEKSGYQEIDDLVDTLNYATVELGKTDKVRKELIGNVSHDLKTPLTMIKAYAEMIRDLSGDNKQKREEHLKVIIDETDRLTRLVNDMMDLSKIESGITKLEKTKFNITDTVNKMVENLKILNKDGDCQIKVESQDDLYVLADKTKIEQVLYNLLVNAINHSGESKKIVVKITTVGKRIKVQVIDNGPGIAKEDIPHIWNRYYRASKSFGRASSGGSGLGLSIVKNILELHNSNFGVDSKLNVGSTFYFDLEKVNKKEMKKDTKELKEEQDKKEGKEDKDKKFGKILKNSETKENKDKKANIDNKKNNDN